MDEVDGHAREPASIIVSATTGCPTWSMNGIAQQRPATHASVIRSQGTDLSLSPCIMPTQSIGMVAGAIASIAAVAGLAAIATVCPKSPSKAAMTSTIFSARLI